MKGLIPELNKECKTVFLECELFDNITNLRSFCEGIAPLNKLLVPHLREASSKQLLVTLNLTVFLKTPYKEYGCILPLFLQLLRDNYYDNDDERWHKIDKLHKKLTQELDNKVKTYDSKNTFERQNILKSIIEEIDFKEQENAVIKAINSQKCKRTAAFLVEGDERYGQQVFITRLLRKLPELRSPEKITISLARMIEVGELWNQTALYFFDKSEITGMLQEHIIDAIFKCLQTKNLLFIFSEADSAYKFMPKLIEEFWQPILARANHEENYLVMLLLDKKGKICVKAKEYLAWHFEDHEYPRFPLHLNVASKFVEQQLAEWLNAPINQKMLPRDILSKDLMRDSEGGVPQLVYKKICYYCDFPWEEFAQCLIQ